MTLLFLESHLSPLHLLLGLMGDLISVSKVADPVPSTSSNKRDSKITIQICYLTLDDLCMLGLMIINKKKKKKHVYLSSEHKYFSAVLKIRPECLKIKLISHLLGESCK